MELKVGVTRGLEPMAVVVLPGQTIGHAGDTLTEGQMLVLDGPTAVEFITAGHVEGLGTAE